MGKGATAALFSFGALRQSDARAATSDANAPLDNLPPWQEQVRMNEIIKQTCPKVVVERTQAPISARYALVLWELFFFLRKGFRYFSSMRHPEERSDEGSGIDNATA